MSSIAELCESYSRITIPDGANEVQVRITRQSFWAGAAAMFSLMTAIGDVDEAQAMLRVQGLQAELREYMAQLRRPVRPN